MLSTDKTIGDALRNRKHDFVVPQKHKYPLMRIATPSKNIPSKRRSKEPIYSSASSGNNIIRFDYPRADFQDFREGFIAFDLALTKVGGTYARLSQGVGSIVERMKIFLGEKEVEDVQSYNLLCSYIHETANNTDAASAILRKTAGVGTQLERNAMGAVTTEYHLPLVSGFLDWGVYPLKFMNDVLRIELHMANVNTCVETDGTDPVFTINNAIFHTNRVEHLGPFEDRIQSMLKAGIPMSYPTYTHYLANAAGNSKQDVQVPHVSDLVRKIHTFLQDSTTATSLTANEKLLNWPKGGINSIHYEINNRNYPDEPMSAQGAISNDVYQAYLRSFGYWKLNGLSQLEPSIDVDTFNLNRFFLLLDLQSAPNEELISGSTLSSDASDFLMKIIFDAPLANHYIHTFVEHERLGVIRGSNSITSRKF